MISFGGSLPAAPVAAATVRKESVEITPLRHVEVTRLSSGDVIVALVAGDGGATMRVSSLHLPVKKLPALQKALTLITKPPRAGAPATPPPTRTAPPPAPSHGRIATARALAELRGESRFRVHAPCAHGHRGERFTRTGACCVCAREWCRRWRTQPPKRKRRPRR